MSISITISNEYRELTVGSLLLGLPVKNYEIVLWLSLLHEYWILCEISTLLICPNIGLSALQNYNINCNIDSQFRTEHARDAYYDYYENDVPQSKEVIDYLP